MDFSLTDNQSMLRKTAREFLKEECPPELVKKMEEDPRGYPEELWRRIAAIGWLGTAVPEEYGGQGGGFFDLLLVLQELGRAAAPVPFFSTAVLGGLAILEAGTEKQKQALLPRLCDGTLVIGFGLFEPGIDDPERIRAVAKKEKGAYAVTGTKLFVSDAHVSDLIICVASAPARTGRRTVGVMVDPKSPGVSLSPLQTNVRDKQFEVTFSNVRVDGGQVLEGAGDGAEWLGRLLAKAAVAKCAEMVGAGQTILQMTVEYAKARVQFGRPIGSFQAIQHHCANLATYVETAELITYRAGWMIQEGLPYAKEVARAKAWTNEACKRAAALAHQVHAGIGFTREYDLYLYSGRINASAYLFGDTAWCYDEVAEALHL